MKCVSFAIFTNQEPTITHPHLNPLELISISLTNCIDIRGYQTQFVRVVRAQIASQYHWWSPGVCRDLFYHHWPCTHTGDIRYHTCQCVSLSLHVWDLPSFHQGGNDNIQIPAYLLGFVCITTMTRKIIVIVYRVNFKS